MKKKALAFLCGMGLAGGVVFGSGCFGFGGFNANQIFRELAFEVGYDFLADNDSVFDLFQDDFGTGTTYDDRGTNNPTRDEPDVDN